jgi:hypothetical protein
MTSSTVAPRRVGLRNEERYPVAEIREAVFDSGIPLTQIARELGWLRNRGRQADAARLRRTLGLEPQPSGYVNRNMRYSTALAIAEAIGVERVDVGL